MNKNSIINNNNKITSKNISITSTDSFTLDLKLAKCEQIFCNKNSQAKFICPKCKTFICNKCLITHIFKCLNKSNDSNLSLISIPSKIDYFSLKKLIDEKINFLPEKFNKIENLFFF